MEKKLSLSANFYIGSMLFGFFFGAGNLIFPVHLGQEAGSQTLAATIGFILTATGLPFLGVLAIGISNSGGLLGLASRVGRSWGYFFTILLYLAIGPLCAHPRTGTVSYEIGFSLYMPEPLRQIGLTVFTILFFSAALFFALRPGRLMLWVGKVLTPLFLLVLGILIAAAFLYPMGSPASAPAHGAYVEQAFFKGATEGYNTLDALAALAFGMLVVDALAALGVTKPKDVAASTAKAGLVSVLLMVIIYACLSFMGAMSMGQLELSDNGGIALAQITHHYFGGPGSVLLALIVTLACLKTAIGLTSSCAGAFAAMFPNSLSYRAYAVVFSVLSCGIANIGLARIISFSIPMLMFLYPPAMVLVILSLLPKAISGSRAIYVTTTAATALASVGDALAAAPDFIVNLAPVRELLVVYGNLPLSGAGMGWTLPAAVGFLAGLALTLLRNNGTRGPKAA